MKKMMRLSAALWIAACLAFTPLSAQQTIVEGFVQDSTQRVPYASVYLKGHPDKGTQGASDGSFTLRIKDTLLPDTLVISFVGYHTQYYPIAPSPDTVRIEALLRQNIIELTGPVVSAKAKRRYKVQVGDILDRIRARMEEDFAQIEAVYRVQTNTSFSSSDKILAYQENLVDTYDPGHRQKDMTRRLKTKVYFDRQAYQRMQQVDTLRNLDPTVNIIGLTVSEGMIRKILREKDSKWEYLGQMNDEIVVTYFEIIRFLGMFRLGQQFVLYVDSQTYSIRRAEAIMAIYVNIPFGKRLPEQALPYLNILNISDREFDKFRLKKVEGEFRMTSRFVRRGESLYRGDSYSHGQAVISSGGKEPSLYIGLKSDTKILNITTENITPITEEQTREKPELIIVDDL